jgi:RNA polymerase sigma-70 factor (ECF subfamily)
MAAEDLNAEVFERMYITHYRFNPEKAPFSAWIFGITRYSVNDHNRKQKRNRDVHTEETENGITPDGIN